VTNLRAVPPYAPPLPPSFSGERGQFRRLLTRGAGLELVTAGFYRFWLVTDIRRHLWSNTIVDDDAFEYTGRGKELLIGFLFALAIMVPVYLAYLLVGLEAERLETYASVPLIAFFYVFGQFASYRARRYRLTRTVWRGLRFWVSGSGWAYAARSALWDVLTLLSLGLFLPWRDAALERYKMRHSHYGELQGSFEGRGWDFFKRGWWLWLLALIPVGIAILLLLEFLPALSPLARIATHIAVDVALIITFFAPLIYGAFKAAKWRWLIAGMRFGDVQLDSALQPGALVGLYWKVTGWFLLIAAAFVAYLLLCAASIAILSHTPLVKAFTLANWQGNVPMLVLGGIGYLALVLLLNVVVRIYLLRDLWAILIRSTIVHRIDAAANVTVAGHMAGAVGEGLEGLDMAGV
jgi:uncharacterized membrane protein YjgN (DUF898 family)